MIFRISFFTRVSDVIPKVREFSNFKGLAHSCLLEHKERLNKDGPLMSFAQFDKRRANEDVLCLQGAVLDFDQAGPGEQPCEIVRHLGGLTHAWHTTWSGDNGSWRLYVPFSAPVPGSVYGQIFAHLQDLLKYPSSLDKSSSELSRSYYLPSCQPGAFRAADYADGALFDVAAFLTTHPPVQVNGNGNGHCSGSGRNNNLKSLVAAMLHRGEGIDAVVAEALAQDQKHEKPLFTDESEGYRGTAEAGALKFVANVFSSLSRSLPVVSVGDSQPPPIVNEKPPLNLKLFQHAPGLVGSLASHINETSIFRHPPLALAASLAFVGALKGHRVRTVSNLRTNLLTIGLAPSGAGKGHALEVVKALAVESGLTGLLMGDPASDSALLKALVSGPKFLGIDEVGLMLGQIGNSKAPTYQAAIMGTIMKLFSSAGGYYGGREYASNVIARITLNQPHLAIYGLSTPARFWECFSSSHAVDGFLSRWLVFEAGPTPDRQVRTTTSLDTLIREIEQMLKSELQVRGRGNVGRITDPEPLVVPQDDATVRDLELAWDSARAASIEREDGLEALWARGMEHVLKIALTTGNMTERGLLWANDLVWALVTQTCDRIGGSVSDSRHEARQQKIVMVLRKAGGAMEKKALYRATRAWTKMERQEAIDCLVEQGIVRAIRLAGITKPAQRFELVTDSPSS